MVDESRFSGCGGRLRLYFRWSKAADGRGKEAAERRKRLTLEWEKVRPGC